MASLIISLLAFAGAFGGVYVAYLAFVDTVNANRAWVDPAGLALAVPLEQGFPVRVQLLIVNPGKAPAIGVIWNVNQPKLIEHVPFYVKDENAYYQNWENRTCDGLSPSSERGITLFPFNEAKNTIPMVFGDSLGNRLAVSRALKHEGSILIEGCLAYVAADDRHTSRFRFFLRDVPDKPSTQWNFNRVLTGNQAD